MESRGLQQQQYRVQLTTLGWSGLRQLVVTDTGGTKLLAIGQVGVGTKICSFSTRNPALQNWSGAIFDTQTQVWEAMRTAFQCYQAQVPMLDAMHQHVRVTKLRMRASNVVTHQMVLKCSTTITAPISSARASEPTAASRSAAALRTVHPSRCKSVQLVRRDSNFTRKNMEVPTAGTAQPEDALAVVILIPTTITAASMAGCRYAAALPAMTGNLR